VNNHTIVIIGSGFGGLSAAIRLRAMGYRVLVLEAGSQAGGRARLFEKNGFRFDAGPTVVTAPHLFDELFELVGRDPGDYYRFLPVDPYYRVLFQDGSSFDYSGNEERLLQQIEKLSPRDVDGYIKLAKQVERIFDIGYTQLADQPFETLWDMARIVPDMIRLGSYRSVYGLVSRYIKDPRLRQAFTFQPLLIGGNPFRVPAIYLLIHWLERKWGIHFVAGGTIRLVEALTQLAEEIGIELRYHSPVAEIEVQSGRVGAVRLATGERIACSLVVANADPSTVYTQLIDAKHRKKYSDRAVAALRHSMSLFVLYFATQGSYPDLAHHSIILGPRYRELLEDIFNRRVLAEDFSLYLHAPLRTDKSLAPDGCDLFYALSPVPNQLSGLDWETLAPLYRERIIAFLEQEHLPGLRDNLLTSFSVDPRYFENELRSHQGAGFGPEPRLTQSAYFRYHNRSQDIEGLFFVGAGVHPGAGLPGVLTSAKVLEKLIAKPDHPVAVPEPKKSSFNMRSKPAHSQVVSL
jgi:phytoene desaturase